MIIAFAGKAGVGKDLAGKYLVDNDDFLHYYFSKPLKEGCKHLFNLSDEQIANKETVIDYWNMSPRKIYQQVGTEIGRGLDEQIWIKNAEIFINENSSRNIVITDCRFSNEAFWVRKQKGIVIQIKRDKKDIIEKNHSSENGMRVEDFDFIVSNNGTKNELFKEINSILEIYQNSLFGYQSNE